MKMHVQLGFFLLLPLIIIKMATGSTSGINSIGEIVPRKDFNLAVGKDLILYCTINGSHSEAFQPSDIQWYSKEISWEKFSSVVNESTVQLKIPNITKSYPTGYSCKLNTTKGLEDVSLRDVKIGDPPSASNFNCISVALLNLTCTWDSSPNDIPTNWTLHGTGVDWKECVDKNNTRISINQTRCPYVAQLPIEDNYTLEEQTLQGNFNETRNNNSGKSYNTTQDTTLPVCNNITKFLGRKRGCIYPSDNDFNRSIRNYIFTLEGTNIMGNFSQTYSIELHKRVVPPEPMDLEILEFPNVLRFKWFPPDVLINFKIEASYHLQYRSQWNNTWTTLLMSNSTTYNLTNIIANTQYEVRVQCRPEKADSDDVWGPFASKNFTTQSTVPTSAPLTIPGCFQEIDQNAAHGNRNMIVYWKAIPEMKQNGSNFHYEIQVEKMGGDNSSVTQITNRSFVKIENLEMEESYEVNIFAVNSQGKSKKSARITIPKTSEKLQFPQDLTVTSDDNINYEILWRPPKQSQLNGYTIFWCNNLTPNTTCESDLSWTTAKATASSLNWFLPKSGKLLRFAISSNSMNSSSGLKWAECAHQPRAEKMFELVEVKIAESNNVAMYLKAKCNFGIIDKFLFHYIEANSRESCFENLPHKLNATMYQNATGSKEFHLKLEDHLESFTWYRFSVASVSRGRQSNWQHGCEQTDRIDHHKSSSNELSDGIVTLIVFSSVVCVAVIVVVLVKSWKRARKVWIKLYRPGIHLPGGMEKCGKAGNGSSFVIDGSTEKSRNIANINSCKAIISAPQLIPMPTKPSTEDCHSTGKGSLSSTTTNQTRLSCDSTPDQEVFMRDSECDESSSVDEAMESTTHADVINQIRYPDQNEEYQSAEPLFKKATAKLIPGYTPIALVDCELGYRSGGQNGTKEKYDNPLANLKTVIGRAPGVDLENQTPYLVLRNLEMQFQLPKNHNVPEPTVGSSTGLDPEPWTAYSVLSTLENGNNDSSDKLTNCAPQSNMSDCCGAEGYVKLDNIDINNDDPGCMLPEGSTAYVDGGIYCDNGYDPC